MEIQGKKYEVIILRDLKEKGKSPEFLLEGVLNEYAEAGYKAICVWKDALIMEKIGGKK